MAVSVVSFSFSRGCSTGGPGAQLSAGWWLSLLHLITNLVWAKTPSRVLEGSFRPGCGFPYHILSPTSLTPQLLSWPSYTIVQRPFNCPLNLWNGIFDCHQVEITVMQFTGHSLPGASVYECTMGILPCPILLAKSTYAISPHNCHRNVSLPSGASLWNAKFGLIEGQNTTYI